jgi:Domain of Unknown Function (DUF928)
MFSRLSPPRIGGRGAKLSLTEAYVTTSIQGMTPQCKDGLRHLYKSRAKSFWCGDLYSFLYIEPKPMTNNRLSFSMAIAASLAVNGIGINVKAATIEINHSTNKQHSIVNYILLSKYIPPGSGGAPGKRGDAGSRPSCPAFKKPFTAIIPGNNLGQTVSKHPTFWLYVPYQSVDVKLILKDENTKDKVYERKFQVKNGPGIVSIKMPEDAPSLELNKKYRWRFDLFCNQTDSLSVNGVVQRVAMPSGLENSLKKASPLERINLYGKNSLWYETFTELAELRRRNPKDAKIAAEWASLLKDESVVLDDMVAERVK